LSGDELHGLAEEQAALRRVATLVARGVSPAQVFASVTEEVGRLLSVEYSALSRYEPGGMVSVAGWGRTGRGLPVGGRWPLEGTNVSTLVFETGRPARVDSYADAVGPFGDAAREYGIGSGVGTPVIVDGHLWGVMAVYSTVGRPLPADIEERLVAFTELVATAISIGDARAAVTRLAEEQAALRRTAMLVARGVPAGELFGAVTEEAATLLGADLASMARLEADDMLTVVATWPGGVEQFEVGARWSREASNLGARVWRTGQPARIDGQEGVPARLAAIREELGIRSSVASPIVVEGALWGGLVVHSKRAEPLPRDTESRLADFTELVATAIANAESRSVLARLAEEQEALRRVATLVARGASPEEVFATVAEQVGRLLGMPLAAMARYGSDDTVTVLATWAAEDPHGGAHPLVPGPWPLDGDDLASTIWRTGRPVRIEDYRHVPGPIAEFVREELGVRSSVGSPIVVEGRLWGALFVHSRETQQPLQRDIEARLTGFTELVATAVANAEGRAELVASRARIVTAADETRRQIERDLHDGIQQRLVSLQLELRGAQAAVPPELGELDRELSDVGEGLASALEELQEISRGIHPAILSKGGLEPALNALRSRSSVPVELDMHPGQRLPEHVEVAAYYVVSEALTNAAKHARASVVNIELSSDDRILRLVIRDDGIGGADLSQGSGLVGLSDRIDALGGRVHVTSPVGTGTTLMIEVPLDDQNGTNGLA
jgi:signal transduction histidine kinase